MLLTGFVCLVWLLLFTVRLLGPSELMARDQQRPASCVMDGVQNGNWVCQRDDRGGVTSKPPMLTWLSALATITAGRISLVTFYLPSALAVLLASLLILGFGSRSFGAPAGLVGTLAYLASKPGVKELCRSGRSRCSP